MTKDEDSLSIADVNRRDEGVYTCRVKSELEDVTVSAKLIVMGTSTYTLILSTCIYFWKYIYICVYMALLSDRPDPPTDLEISDPTERSVRLTWVPGRSNHSPIKGRRCTDSSEYDVQKEIIKHLHFFFRILGSIYGRSSCWLLADSQWLAEPDQLPWQPDLSCFTTNTVCGVPLPGHRYKWHRPQ